MVKINDEQLNALKTAKGEMEKIQAELGMIALMELRKAVILQEYAKRETTINETIEAINAEHGDGSLDLETGEFTPAAQ